MLQEELGLQSAAELAVGGAAYGLHDSNDKVYPATATAGGAVPIADNRRDFTEPRYGPVEVLPPRAFLDRTTDRLTRNSDQDNTPS